MHRRGAGRWEWSILRQARVKSIFVGGREWEGGVHRGGGRAWAGSAPITANEHLSSGFKSAEQKLKAHEQDC